MRASLEIFDHFAGLMLQQLAGVHRKAGANGSTLFRATDEQSLALFQSPYQAHILRVAISPDFALRNR